MSRVLHRHLVVVVVVVVVVAASACRTARDPSPAAPQPPDARPTPGLADVGPSVDAGAPPADGGPINLRPSDADVQRMMTGKPATSYAAPPVCPPQMGTYCAQGRQQCGKDEHGCERCTCVRDGDVLPTRP